MKKHAIIPIFIPHLGCPEKCVFCDQIAITARKGQVTEDEVRRTIEVYLDGLGDTPSKDVEIAFYGGSFTGIPLSLQEKYLAIAKEYVDKGLASGIHLSTRPDYINPEVLDLLKKYGVKVIELGVQSFDDRVLELSKRGHNSKAVYQAAHMIKEYGFDLGIQLMIGLPGDSLESCIFSAKETLGLKPKLARLYPTVVLPNTELYEMFQEGSYSPLSREEAISRTAQMYKILWEGGITIMRVGLKSTDIINSQSLGEINKGTYHPAFRQLVEGEIAREKIDFAIESSFDGILPSALTVASNPLWISSAAGHNGTNRDFFKAKYPNLELNFVSRENIPPGEFEIYETNGGLSL